MRTSYAAAQVSPSPPPPLQPPPLAEAALHAAVLGAQSLSHARKAHAQATVGGLLHRSLPICAALILAYSDFREPAAARRLFDQSPLRQRGAFLWNSLVRSLTKGGFHGEAFVVYNRMAREGFRPDDRTFPFILTACAGCAAVRKGMEVHGSALKSGFAGDVFVGNTLLAFYGACFLPWEALQIFDSMRERDVVSWNSLISLFCNNGCSLEAVRYFRELKRTELAVNSVTVVSVLSACQALETDALVTGKGIHGHIIKLGLDSQVTVGNVLVDMYSKCGDLESSIRAFNSIAEKNDVSWNTIIGGLVHGGLPRDALAFFRAMAACATTQPNSVTISSFLPGLAELGFHRMGREVHGHSTRRGWDSDLFVANSLLDMYAKWGRPREAASVFYAMECRNVVSWNAMIANLAQNKRELEAIALVREMQAKGESPNSVTLTNVLPACARMAASKPGKEIHGRSIRVVCSDIFISNALIDMYAKSGCLGIARTLFEISERDEVSYNALIVGYSRSLYCFEALDLFVEMGLVGLSYDAISVMGALSACGNLSTVKRGKEVHGFAVRRHLHCHLFVANSLLDLYTKRGHLDAARRVFDRIEDKDVASWNAMILGYGMQGEPEIAIDLFDRMKEENVDYDSVSYVAVLSACSHCKLVERGKMYFNGMVSHNIERTEMHYACMVDLLGRAGFMDEAADFIKALPFQPGSDVWGALLGASRVHGNLELGRWAAEHLFELKPGHSGYYTLLSNMYAEAGRWDEAIGIRERMKSRGVRKNPGCSWVDTGSRTHAFLVGESLEELRGGADLYRFEFG